MQAQKLVREILQFTRIIESDRAALWVRTVSKTDKAHLHLAIDQRTATLAVLKEQLAVVDAARAIVADRRKA